MSGNGLRELLRHRDLRICTLGNTVSMLGDSAFWLASSIWVKELTGSTARAGLAVLCLTLGTLLSPATGVLVDRMRRRRLLMATNAATALMVLSLTTVDGAGRVWLIDTVMFGYGLSSTITSSAFAGLREALMPRELIGSAIGLSQALSQGARLITPGIGLGVLAAWGGHALAVADAATFGVSLLCWSLVRIEDPRPAPPSGPRPGWFAEALAGFRFLFGRSLLWRLSLALAIALFAMGFYETLGISVVTLGLHRAPAWVGVLITAMSATGLVGGLFAPALIERIGPGRTATAGLSVCAAAVAFVAVPQAGVVLAAAAAFGLGLAPVVVASMTSFQLHTPNELLGRVTGAANLIVTGMQGLGITVGAALVNVLPYRGLVFLSAGVLAVAAAFLAAAPPRPPSDYSLEEMSASNSASRSIK